MNARNFLPLIAAVSLGGCMVSPSTGPSFEEAAVSSYEPAGRRLNTLPARDPATEGHELKGARPATESVRQAIERAMPFLERDGVAWMDGRIPVQDGQGCVSCHHVPFAVWSYQEAVRAGFDSRPEMEALSRRAVDFAGQASKARALNIAPLLLGGAEPSDFLAQRLAERQQDDGTWRARGQFPSQRRSTEESDLVASHWSLLALRASGPETQSEAQRNAADSLVDQPLGETVEWRVTALLTAAESQQEHLLSQLLRAQNEDGSWPWRQGEVGNAYSTGQALYALGLINGEHQESIQRARTYLLNSQKSDGTWSLPSALISDDHSEAHDVIYHYWGTAWAVIGLARSL